MGASKSPHGFVVVRGRGYRPEQVDRAVSTLTEEYDGAVRRLARLVSVAGNLSAEAERLRSVAASLPPQTYESLGKRARLLLSESEAEAAELRAAAEAEARWVRETAQAEARLLTETARRAAADVRAKADAFATTTVASAQARADELHSEAHQESETLRGKAETALREVARHCHSLLADQSEQQAARSDALDRELTRQSAAMEATTEALTERGNTALAEAKRLYGQAEEATRHGLEDAEAHADELVVRARMQEQRIERETQRVLREHAERADQVRRHLAHVRSSLATLSGRAPNNSNGSSTGSAGPTGTAHTTGSTTTATPAIPADAADAAAHAAGPVHAHVTGAVAATGPPTPDTALSGPEQTTRPQR